MAEFKSLEDAMLDLHAPGRIEFVERKDPIVTGPPLGIPVLTPETPSVVWALRRHQEKDPILGPLFHDLHVFADRTIAEFYKDTPSLPHPVVAAEKDRRTRLGYFTTIDGHRLPLRINLNLGIMRDGWEAAETLAHEIVHLWQAHIGEPCKNNYHGKAFHMRMAEYGIRTEGSKGFHVGYDADGTWAAWRQRNADLEALEWPLPGRPEPTKKLAKYQCPSCEVRIRHRRKDLSLACLDCETALVRVG